MADVADRSGPALAAEEADIRRRAAAMAQPEDGNGICIDCEEPIEPDRWEARPGCLRCMSCQEDQERRTRRGLA